MTTDRRLERLRDLVHRVERMPPSPERERVLREIRARAVDVDTGVAPRAMLPPDPAPPIRQAPRRKTAADSKPTQPPAPAEVDPVGQPDRAAEPERTAPAATGPVESLLARADQLLTLEEGQGLWPSAEGHEPTEQDARPWRKGLRG